MPVTFWGDGNGPMEQIGIVVNVKEKDRPKLGEAKNCSNFIEKMFALKEDGVDARVIGALLRLWMYRCGNYC